MHMHMYAAAHVHMCSGHVHVAQAVGAGSRLGLVDEGQRHLVDVSALVRQVLAVFAVFAARASLICRPVG